MLHSFLAKISDLDSYINNNFFVSSVSQVERLKAELIYERRTGEEHLSQFEEERRVWQEEKEKVTTCSQWFSFPLSGLH